jgi:hypothetical protein
VQLGMSALGHKRTYAVQKGMSALHPKADIPFASGEPRCGVSGIVRSCYRKLIAAPVAASAQRGPTMIVMMPFAFELITMLAMLALGFVLGRIWEIRQQMSRKREREEADFRRIPTARLTAEQNF